MKKILIIMQIAVIAIFCGCDCKEEKFSIPSLNGRRVVDATGKTLTSKEAQKLEDAIKSFEKTTGGQFAVCIVPHFKGETVESASMKVAESWKIGHKGKDNGILFFLSMREREFRIEVGYGFEGKLNDAKAGGIGRSAIPKFKQKQWSKGIEIIISGCQSAISGKELETEDEMSIGCLILIAAIAIVAIIIFISLSTDGFTSGGSSFGGGPSFKGGGFSGGGGGFGGGGFSGKF